jgi:hypothetical protein
LILAVLIKPGLPFGRQSLKGDRAILAVAEPIFNRFAGTL